MYFLHHLFDCQDYSDPLEHDDIEEFLPAVEYLAGVFCFNLAEDIFVLISEAVLGLP